VPSEKAFGPVTPEGARPESQFFTVPSVYLKSVTLSSYISPIWFYRYS
jgi:hypothetical protein